MNTKWRVFQTQKKTRHWVRQSNSIRIDERVLRADNSQQIRDVIVQRLVAMKIKRGSETEQLPRMIFT